MKKIITFDLYGTLVDIKKAMKEYFLSLGFDENRSLELYNEWNALNFKNVNSKKISFKESAEQLLSDILRREKSYSDENIRLFLEYYSKAKPFEDTLDFLDKAKKKYKIAIISNIDNDLIENTTRFFEFDEIITAQDAGYFYKPQREIFEFALKKLGCVKDDIMHVAFSLRADLKGVVPLGWDMIWVNRNKQKNDSGLVPLFECNDLKETAKFLKI